eukprot:3820021-Rhodomonas_salina.2
MRSGPHPDGNAGKVGGWRGGWKTVLLDATAYCAVVVLRAAMRCLPVSFIFAQSFVKRVVAKAFFFRRSRTNLEIVLPVLQKLRQGHVDARQLSLDSSTHALSSLFALLRLPISHAELTRSISCDAFRDELLTDIHKGQGVVLVSAHVGYWELLVPRILAELHGGLSGMRVGVAYKPLHNRHLDRLVRQVREDACRGLCEMIPASGSLQTLAAVLEGGGMVGLVPDQRVARQHPAREGSTCRFFEEELPCHDGFARLSEQAGWCPRQRSRATAAASAREEARWARCCARVERGGAGAGVLGRARGAGGRAPCSVPLGPRPLQSAQTAPAKGRLAGGVLRVKRRGCVRRPRGAGAREGSRGAGLCPSSGCDPGCAGSRVLRRALKTRGGTRRGGEGERSKGVLGSLGVAVRGSVQSEVRVFSKVVNMHAQALAKVVNMHAQALGMQRA